mmetsp:Transcript_8612/g.15722  ORF Transcript_8612/g.15722 Transcript_8612/m.15722 type:complete len:111 (+) Transcript_8612:721-1053(+)
MHAAAHEKRQSEEESLLLHATGVKIRPDGSTCKSIVVGDENESSSLGGEQDTIMVCTPSGRAHEVDALFSSSSFPLAPVPGNPTNKDDDCHSFDSARCEIANRPIIRDTP